METYGYGIILIMIVTMLWYPVLHGYDKLSYTLALTFWLLCTFGQTAMSEHSTMASTLQFDQVICHGTRYWHHRSYLIEWLPHGDPTLFSSLVQIASFGLKNKDKTFHNNKISAWSVTNGSNTCRVHPAVLAASDSGITISLRSLVWAWMLIFFSSLSARPCWVHPTGNPHHSSHRETSWIGTVCPLAVKPQPSCWITRPIQTQNLRHQAKP